MAVKNGRGRNQKHGRFPKGSEEAKEYMARLRARRKSPVPKSRLSASEKEFIPILDKESRSIRSNTVSTIANARPKPESKASKRQPATNPLYQVPIYFFVLAIIIITMVVLFNSIVRNAAPVTLSTTSPTSTMQTATSSMTTTVKQAVPVVAQPDYIYCISRSNATNSSYDHNSFSAAVSDNGIGAQARFQNPGLSAIDECFTDYGNIYCIGKNASNATASYVYSAKISNGSVGAWHLASKLPVSEPNAGGPGSSECDTSDGYVYCLGPGNASSTSAYYASVSASGMGAWAKTTSIQTDGAYGGASCNIRDGTMYCIIAGIPYYNQSNGMILGQYFDSYYANVSSSGIGRWKAGSIPAIPLIEPTTVLPSCFIWDGRLFCSFYERNGFVYTEFANVSQSGIGKWNYTNLGSGQNTYSGAIPISPQCAASQKGYLYCVNISLYNQRNNTVSYASEYAQLSSNGIGAWARQASFPAVSSCVIPQGKSP